MKKNPKEVHISKTSQGQLDEAERESAYKTGLQLLNDWYAAKEGIMILACTTPAPEGQMMLGASVTGRGSEIIAALTGLMIKDPGLSDLVEQAVLFKMSQEGHLDDVMQDLLKSHGNPSDSQNSGALTPEEIAEVMNS